ncbi:MAG: hypothetical protein ACE37M_13300 [Henriciella sp.]
MSHGPFSALLTGSLMIALAGCETTASLSEAAIRRASFDRVHATPFTDQLDAKKCRASLDQAFGFPRSSLAVRNGVKVTQDYACKGKTIIAKVSLTNLNDHTMYCAATTETGESGAMVGPHGVAFLEYGFLNAVTYDCFDVS